MMMPILVGTGTATDPGVSGSNSGSFSGVRGSNTGTGVGVRGFADNADGVRGDSKGGGAGVRGVSTGTNHYGVVGECTGPGGGVLGYSRDGTGVHAETLKRGHGVYAISRHGDGTIVKGGIDGLVKSGAGVMGVSSSVSILGLVNPGGWHPDELKLPYSHYSIGVCGAFHSTFPHSNPGREAPLPWDVPYFKGRLSSDNPHVGVYGMANAALVGVTPFESGYGLLVANTKGGHAAAIQGNVEIDGDIELTGAVRTIGCDCAEIFELADACRAEPGDVLVVGDDGRLIEASTAYDSAVVGVVSGAHDEQPGIILGGNKAKDGRQAAIALMGRVWCKVDAAWGAVKIGDMLTTSPTPGYAMKADNASLSPGTILGKALQPIKTGRGMISVLVTLQ
jgi:hypothetical protein